MSEPTPNKISWPILVVGMLVVIPLLLVLARGFSFDPRRIDSPLIGEPAPAFELPRLDDGSKLVSLESLRGKPVLVNFWATWCVSCPDEHPWLVELAREHGDDVQFVGIAYEEKNAEIEAWLARHGGEAYPTLVDINGKAAIAFGVYGVPETYLIDSEGIIRDKITGPVADRRGPIHLARLQGWFEELSP